MTTEPARILSAGEFAELLNRIVNDAQSPEPGSWFDDHIAIRKAYATLTAALAAANARADEAIEAREYRARQVRAETDLRWAAEQRASTAEERLATLDKAYDNLAELHGEAILKLATVTAAIDDATDCTSRTCEFYPGIPRYEDCSRLACRLSSIAAAAGEACRRRNGFGHYCEKATGHEGPHSQGPYEWTP